MSHYIIFGDSIGCGEGDPQGGWAKLLGEKYSVKNLSIDGATTNDYLKNFPADIDKNSTLIIALGVNDSAWVPLEKYKNNLLQLIKLGKKYTDKIILISPAPIDQVKADPVPWAPEISYKTDLVQQYSEVMKAVAARKKVKFINLFNNLRSDYIHCLDDGVHPNHAGHQMIFEIINQYL